MSQLALTQELPWVEAEYPGIPYPEPRPIIERPLPPAQQTPMVNVAPVAQRPVVNVAPVATQRNVQGYPPQMGPVVREGRVNNPYYNPQGSVALAAAGGPPPTMHQTDPYATAAWAYDPQGRPHALLGFPSRYPHVVHAGWMDTTAPYMAVIDRMAAAGAARRAGFGPGSVQFPMPRAAAAGGGIARGAEPVYTIPDSAAPAGKWDLNSEAITRAQIEADMYGKAAPPPTLPPTNGASPAPAMELVPSPELVDSVFQWQKFPDGIAIPPTVDEPATGVDSVLQGQSYPQENASPYMPAPAPGTSATDLVTALAEAGVYDDPDLDYEQLLEDAAYARSSTGLRDMLTALGLGTLPILGGLGTAVRSIPQLLQGVGPLLPTITRYVPAWATRGVR